MISNKPSVAVIIPTYNRWPHVCTAIDSVLAQTYPEVECIVVDDASTDHTVERLQKKYNSNIKIISHSVNRQKSAARNTGIQHTDADYVCMLDSDDLLPPDSIKDRLDIFLDNPDFNGVAYGYAVAQGQDPLEGKNRQSFPEGDVVEAYLDTHFLQNNDYMISRANMLKFGMYREELTNREDVELLIRLACSLSFKYCGACTAEIRRVDKSARDDLASYTAQDMSMVKSLKANPLVSKRLGPKITKIEFEELSELARAHYHARNYRQFRHYAHQLIRKYPRSSLTSIRLLRRLVFSCLRRPANNLKGLS